ncbi:LamG-like jellyroll fold domain-containing protein [Flavobacterium piscinae]|uniref:LamG-like jellyroll fold domain-containing protein n=1 Tax=Flavobacterium piscinae TaxID=2506424 RepID=UPI002AAA6466|nr:LamG-like jellyroll fold domain-containing protein [Flavobacterium piscinae]
MHVGFRPNNKFTFDFWNNGVDSNATINDTNWHHYAVTYNASSNLQSIYIDGVLDNTRTATTDFNGSGAINIGRVSTFGYYHGNIDDLRVWNYELTQTDITNRRTCELNGNEAGLLVYYQFNQGNGGVNNTSQTGLFDAVSSTNNATFNSFMLNGTTSNFVVDSQVVTDNFTSLEPTVNPQIIYNIGDTATPLTAIGSGLLWYSSENGGTGTATAPTPNTSTAGTFNFYVSSTSGNCESKRILIQVLVGNFTPGSSLNFDGSNDYIIGPNLPLANNSFSIEFWAKEKLQMQIILFFFKVVKIIIMVCMLVLEVLINLLLTSGVMV